MEILYVWIKAHKNIHEQGFNFSPDLRFTYEPQAGSLKINDRRHLGLSNFFGKEISNITAIVGENGSGKSNLLEFLVRLFGSGIGFWDEAFIIIFRYEGDIQVWHYSELPISIINPVHQLTIHLVPFIMKEYGNGMKGGLRGEHEIDKIQIVYSSQYFDGRKKSLGFNRNENFFDISNLRYMLKVQDNLTDREDLISTNSYYLNDMRRQAIFLGAGGRELVEFPVPNFIKITINKDISLDYLNKSYTTSESLPEDLGAEEIWKFFDQPGFIIKAFRSLLFSSLVESKAMTVLAPNYIERIKQRIKEHYPGNDPITLIDDWEDAYQAPFQKITQLIKWISEQCREYIYDQPQDRIFQITEDALIIPTRSPLINNFFTSLESLEIRLSSPFNFAWTFEDHPHQNGGLSSGYNQLLNFFARLYAARDRFYRFNKILFFIDEGEIGLHPQLQKQYINLLIKNIPRIISRTIGDNKAIQIILTSHSPFIISDLPRENIIFLEKNENGTCKVADGLHDMKQTFGANIHTLLSDAFFLRRHEGLMGTFAKSRIDDVIRFYQENEMIDGMNEIESEAFAQKIITWIGEPIIQRYLQQLQQLISQKHVMQEVQNLRSEIEELKKRLPND